MSRLGSCSPATSRATARSSSTASPSLPTRWRSSSRAAGRRRNLRDPARPVLFVQHAGRPSHRDLRAAAAGGRGALRRPARLRLRIRYGRSIELRSRDARFDGLLYVGVTSTGIYCRPVCPARGPKLENCRFFASAAAAQEAGFRPACAAGRRRRPISRPGGVRRTRSHARWRSSPTAVSTAQAGVDALALRLGVGGRQCAGSSSSTSARRPSRSRRRGGCCSRSS